MPRITALAILPAALALPLALGGCQTEDARPATGDGGSEEVASSGPGLSVGERAPDATVMTRDGQPVSLASLYGDGPVVVTFYRGGWCPYCTRQLSEWQGRESELTAAGGRLVAITAESPDNVAKTAGEHGLGFEIYADNTMEAARAFDVYFDLDAGTKSRYKGYGIDLATSNGSGAWSLPAPGTFVIDSDGVIRYAWADWDYKQRADADEVIAAVRAAD